MEFVATTFKNLEPLLVKELQDLGATVEKTPKRAVICQGSKKVFYQCLYKSRLSLRILVPMAKFKIRGDRDLYHESKKIDWDEYMNSDITFTIKASVHSSLFNHTKYPIYKVKDAICDYFVEKHGKRPDIDTEYPEIQFHLRVSEKFVTISRDASGDPLYKRGYKSKTVKAPINEILASAMVMNSDWNDETLLDPMCGSGTILTEAIMIRNNIPAQYFRRDMSIFQWRDFDQKLWDEVTRSYVLPDKIDGKYFGYDEDPRAIDAIESNLENMGLEDQVDYNLDDFFTANAPSKEGIIIFNPPYDERMSLEDASSFYRKIGDKLKKDYKGWKIWIFTSNFDALRKIGMKPSKKLILFNGPLECRFHQYEVFP